MGSIRTDRAALLELSWPEFFAELPNYRRKSECVKQTKCHAGTLFTYMDPDTLHIDCWIDWCGLNPWPYSPQPKWGGRGGT